MERQDAGSLPDALSARFLTINEKIRLWRLMERPTFMRAMPLNDGLFPQS
jgi:hypothetical protein